MVIKPITTTLSMSSPCCFCVNGGHGDPAAFLHGWPETSYECGDVMPVSLKLKSINRLLP